MTLLDSLTDLERRLAAASPAWLARRRGDALDRVRRMGFPTTKVEAWRNTNVKPIVDGHFVAGRGDSPAADALPELARLDLGGPRLVFVDGRLSQSLSRSAGLPEGVVCSSISGALAEGRQELESWLERPGDDGAFASLNTALVQDGVLVVVPDGVSLSRPVQCVYVTADSGEPTTSQLRNVFRVGAGARATVAEVFVSLGGAAHFTNAVSDARVGDNGRLDHYRIQDENSAAYHVASLDSRQGRDSRYRQHNFNLGGKLVRNDIRSILDGEGAQCLLDGLYVTLGDQHVDHYTTLDHARPHGDSREVYKGVLAGASRAVFSGRIIVREGAQKTDAKQSNPNILISDKALAQTRPQLEIYADDVKCTHGATVGRLDADAIFYLRSRGVPAEEARNLLIRAFAAEVLDRVSEPELRRWLDAAFDARLASAGTGEPR